MTTLYPIDDIESFITTRSSYHALAEHVLCRARWEATARIGLRALRGGFGTPHFGDDEQLWINANGLHHSQFATEQSIAITSLREAAKFAGLDAPGAPPEIFTPTTAPDVESALAISQPASERLFAWYGFGAEVLEALRVTLSDGTPSMVQLWPEHFDLAFDGAHSLHARANYGASPGDAGLPEPYLYVGPWDTSGLAQDPFWNQPWGAALRYDALVASPDPNLVAASFFAHARTRLPAT